MVRLRLTGSASESQAKLPACLNAIAHFERLSRRPRAHTYRFFSFALAVLPRTTFAATRRLCALPARCGGFGEADARLITIGELDAGRLECTLYRINRRSHGPHNVCVPRLAIRQFNDAMKVQ
jgi:hypothetical protein